MSILRSERNSAALLLVAALLGLLLANSAAGFGLMDAGNAHLGFQEIGLDLSVKHWISDGLLAIFFFIVAVELKYELVAGALNSVRKAVIPAIAAIGGVVVPAGIYLLMNTEGSYLRGWPIPTATDIAFALGILAIFGRKLPPQIRIFLLALAILDDLIAILIIAIFFSSSLNIFALLAGSVTVIAFGILSRILARNPQRRRSSTRFVLSAVMIILGLLTWYFVYQSGVHATIAGVALGLAMARKPAAATAHLLQPWSNGVALPLFAFSAALITIPSVGISQLSPAFWGILVALPLGKIVGITTAGWLASRFFTPKPTQNDPKKAGETSDQRLKPADVLAVASLGGIGFTVSLLMNELAFSDLPEVAAEGTLAVLLGSTVSIVCGAVLVSIRSHHYASKNKGATLTL